MWNNINPYGYFGSNQQQPVTYVPIFPPNMGAMGGPPPGMSVSDYIRMNKKMSKFWAEEQKRMKEEDDKKKAATPKGFRPLSTIEGFLLMTVVQFCMTIYFITTIFSYAEPIMRAMNK